MLCFQMILLPKYMAHWLSNGVEKGKDMNQSWFGLKIHLSTWTANKNGSDAFEEKHWKEIIHNNFRENKSSYRQKN